MVVAVSWLTLCYECSRSVLWVSYRSSCTPRSFLPFWKISWSVMPMTPTWLLLCQPHALVTITESQIRDLGRISEWRDLWGMKLNASKTKTTVGLQVTPNASTVTRINYWRNCAEGVDDLDLLGVTFDSKMTLKKHLRLVSRAASQRLDILNKSWEVFNVISILGRCSRGFLLPVL